MLKTTIPAGRPAGFHPKSGDSAPSIRSLILLSGLLRTTGFLAATGRSALDLPVGRGRALLDVWCDMAADLSEAMGQADLAMRILVDREVAQPKLSVRAGLPQVSVERDQSELRGTGGVLRDACASYADSDYVVVANAAQVLTEPLAGVVGEMMATGGDVAIVSHEDGTPGGLMLIRCGCLRILPEVGFIDLKEQGLPKIAEDYRVSVVSRASVTGLAVRTLPDYIAALRWLATDPADRRVASDPFAEDWSPTFSVVEDGAKVDPSAQIHDSVVLRGGELQAKAVVVRSVICPGAIVHRGRAVADQLVTESK